MNTSNNLTFLMERLLLMYKNISVKNNGFTFLEVLLVIGIISIVVAFGSSAVISHIHIFNRNDKDYEAFQNARIAINTIVSELRSYRSLQLEGNTSLQGSRFGSNNMENILTNQNDTSFRIYSIFSPDGKKELFYNNGSNDESGIIAENVEVSFGNGYLENTVRIAIYGPADDPNKKLLISTEIAKNYVYTR